VTLVERELGHDEHQLIPRLEPELRANGGDVVRRDAIGLEARCVDADPRHLDETVRRHERKPAHGPGVLVVDHDQVVGPSGRSLLRQGERRVPETPPVRMEVKAVGGVDDDRPVPRARAAQRSAPEEAGDRGVEVDDVVALTRDQLT
jgi:hypothetical protein